MEPALSTPSWSCKEQPGGVPPGTPDVEPEPSVPAEALPDDPTAYRCRGCGAYLARPRDRLLVDGKTLHERVNPAGFLCRFLTLRRCHNTRDLSLPSDDFTWFERHAWVVIACRGCRAHLGWRWEGEPSFFGLLVHQIVESVHGPGDPA